MKQFFPVIKWMINITLVVAVVASAGFVYVWSNGDKLVQTEILKRFDLAAPDLQLVVQKTELQGTRGVILKNVEIRERISGQALFRAKELGVQIDSVQLVEHQQVVVNSIKLTSAEILVSREADGRWNWQRYTFNQPPKAAEGLPRILVEDLRIQMTLKHGAGIPTARLVLDCPQLQAEPASQHSYDFDGGVSLPGVGVLNLRGEGDIRTKQWKLGGRLRNVRANQELMQIATAATPDIQGQLSKIDQTLHRLVPQTASLSHSSTGAALLIGTDARIAPQFLGLLDIDFDAASSDTSIPDFRLKVGVKEGRLASPALPVPLNDVSAVFYKDNSNLIFKLNRATGGQATIKGGFRAVSGERPEPGQLWIEVERFPVTMDLVPLLPAKTQRLFHSFQPDCLITGRAELNQQANGKWRPENLAATVSEGRVNYHKFRYPTSGIRGKITQREFANVPATETQPATTSQDVMLDIALTGQVGDRPVKVNGWMKNPGPTSENFFAMSITDLPIDSELRNALEPKQQSVIDNLNLSGMANANLAFYRPAGLDNPTIPLFDVRVFDARMKFANFPYEIEDLSGHLKFDGATKHWEFLELNGRHGNGRLSATGEFRGKTTPGILQLTINARNAALDSDLYNALSPPQQTVWNMLDPRGFCDLTARIDWTAAPGQPAIVRFPESNPIRVFNTKIRPKPFPYDMYVSEAILSFDPNDARSAGAQKCEIHSFKAMHENSPILASGWAEAKPNDEWQVHLNDVTALDLRPDDQLRAAMPASWHETLARLHQTGTVSIEKSEIDFRGVVSGEKNTTAKWNLNMRFNDCTMNAGLDMEQVYGQVSALGEWDGFNLKNVGQINLETAVMMEMPFTSIRGPYSMNNVELVMGSRKVFDPNPRSQINRNTRVKAQAYGGELFVDALIDMREQGNYRFFTELANARLESYAAKHIPDQRNLQGIVNAWMSIWGEGDDPADVKGKGQMVISPAALYELPVMVKLLGALSQLHLNVQNLTAFNYAKVNFTVGNEMFRLSPIDMVGESISFRGQGTVGFSGAVALDFYSRPPRASLATLPILNNLFTNWAKVEVRGTTSQPQTIVKSAAKMDEGLRQFLQPFNPNPNGPAPMLNVPRMFQTPAYGPAYGPASRQQANGRNARAN